jgi:hypothetical protein
LQRQRQAIELQNVIKNGVPALLENSAGKTSKGEGHPQWTNFPG